MSSAYAKAINSALISKMYKDSDIVVMGQAATNGGRYKETENLLAKFGHNRVLNCGVDVDANLRIALGMAMNGLRPVVFVDGKYLLRAMDALANEIAFSDFVYNSAFASNMVICADVGAKPGANPLHSFLFEGMLSAIPRLKVVYPSNENEAYLLLKDSLDQEGPVLFLSDVKMLSADEGSFEKSLGERIVGRANVLKEGGFATIIAYGPTAKEAKKAAEVAAKAEIYCEVLDLGTLAPLDAAAIVRSVKKTGKVIIAHEGYKTGGLGAEISALISESSAFDYLEKPIMRVCGLDLPLGYNEQMYSAGVPCWENIYEAIIQLT